MTSAGLVAMLGIAAAGCTTESQPHVAPDPGPQPLASPGPQPLASPGPQPLASQVVTWTCTGAPCP